MAVLVGLALLLATATFVVGVFAWTDEDEPMSKAAMSCAAGAFVCAVAAWGIS